MMLFNFIKNFNDLSYSGQKVMPNPTLKRDAAKARRPLALRWAS